MDYNITFPQQTITYINGSGILMISIIFVIGFILYKRYAAKFMPGLMGILAFLMLGIVGTELITLLLSAIPGINRLLYNSAVAFCITRALVFAVLIHVTKILVLKFADMSSNMELGDALMGGLGIAIGQAVVSGMDFMYISSIGSAINQNGVEQFLVDVSAEEAESLLEYIYKTIEIPPMFFLLKGFNCTLDIVFTVITCLFIYAIVKKGLSSVWHVILIVSTTMVQLVSLLGDYGVSSNYFILSALKLLIVIVTVIMAFRIDAEYLAGEFRSFEKLKKKKSMPKFNDVKNK